LQAATTRWRRRGRGKVARRSRRRRDNRGDATTSWQTGGKRERRRTRGKREGRRQRTRGGGAPRGREAVAAQCEASRQPAGGASGASSSSTTSFPPRWDDGAPRKIPSDGGGSNVSLVVREFGIGKFARPPSLLSTPSHRHRHRPRWTRGMPFWRRRRPLQSSCGCSNRCGGWCDKKLTLVIRNYESPVVVLCVVGVWNSLLANGGRIYLIVIPQYVRKFLRRVIIITQKPLHKTLDNTITFQKYRRIIFQSEKFTGSMGDCHYWYKIYSRNLCRNKPRINAVYLRIE
jgi:hypothetical protein